MSGIRNLKDLGMTLDGLALDWFQDIPKNAYTNLEEMEEYFIEAFSLIGIKHNTVMQINNLKQIEIKTVRDYSKSLKKYILRCPKKEIPNYEHLVLIYLEGLLNKKFHAALYPMKHNFSS